MLWLKSKQKRDRRVITHTFTVLNSRFSTNERASDLLNKKLRASDHFNKLNTARRRRRSTKAICDWSRATSVNWTITNECKGSLLWWVSYDFKLWMHSSLFIPLKFDNFTFLAWVSRVSGEFREQESSSCFTASIAPKNIIHPIILRDRCANKTTISNGPVFLPEKYPSQCFSFAKGQTQYRSITINNPKKLLLILSTYKGNVRCGSLGCLKWFSC